MSREKDFHDAVNAFTLDSELDEIMHDELLRNHAAMQQAIEDSHRELERRAKDANMRALFLSRKSHLAK